MRRRMFATVFAARPGTFGVLFVSGSLGGSGALVSPESGAVSVARMFRLFGAGGALLILGQFWELCPAWRHLKHSPSLMHLARSSGVSFSIFILGV